MSKTKTLSAILDENIEGSAKKLKDTPKYTTMQEAKSDFKLNALLHMVSVINGRLIEIQEKLGIEVED
jgi:hypothetical protein